MENQELINMNAEEFAKTNLGKEVWFYDIYSSSTGMIVGYGEMGFREEYIIVSFTSEDKGWGAPLLNSDILLLKSPLNQSFWYVHITDIIKMIQE